MVKTDPLGTIYRTSARYCLCAWEYCEAINEDSTCGD